MKMLSSIPRMALIPLAALTIGFNPMSAQADAGPGSGNGTGFAQLEGFADYAAQSAALRQAISDSVALIKSLGIDQAASFPELTYLTEEVQYSRYLLIPQNITLAPNRAPGDYPIGTNLVASTELVRGAPTKIYPTLITQTQANSQLVQMVIHEALHRALPEPMNSYEPVVVKLTNIITQYRSSEAPKAVRDYLNLVAKKKMPWLVKISERFSGGSQLREEVLRPLFNENLIAEFGGQTRISIEVSSGPSYCEPEHDMQCATTVTVFDNYRGIVYTMDFAKFRIKSYGRSGMIGNLYQGNTLVLLDVGPDGVKAAAQFVRDSIQKIQDDLSWQ
jgi:hypothetical protein